MPSLTKMMSSLIKMMEIPDVISVWCLIKTSTQSRLSPFLCFTSNIIGLIVSLLCLLGTSNRDERRTPCRKRTGWCHWTHHAQEGTTQVQAEGVSHIQEQGPQAWPEGVSHLLCLSVSVKPHASHSLGLILISIVIADPSLPFRSVQLW